MPSTIGTNNEFMCKAGTHVCVWMLILAFIGCASAPQRPTALSAQGPIRISPEAAEAQLVSRILPRPLQWDTKAILMLEVTIDKEGRVANLRLLQGHPLLNEVTLAAVSQWRFKPFLLNGQPTEAITTVSVGYDFGRFY